MKLINTRIKSAKIGFTVSILFLFFVVFIGLIIGFDFKFDIKEFRFAIAIMFIFSISAFIVNI